VFTIIIRVVAPIAIISTIIFTAHVFVQACLRDCALCRKWTSKLVSPSSFVSIPKKPFFTLHIRLKLMLQFAISGSALSYILSLVYSPAAESDSYWLCQFQGFLAQVVRCVCNGLRFSNNNNMMLTTNWV